MQYSYVYLCTWMALLCVCVCNEMYQNGSDAVDVPCCWWWWSPMLKTSIAHFRVTIQLWIGTIDANIIPKPCSMHLISIDRLPVFIEHFFFRCIYIAILNKIHGAVDGVAVGAVEASWKPAQAHSVLRAHHACLSANKPPFRRLAISNQLLKAF